MPSRSSGPGRHPAAIATCLVLACAAVAVFFTATASASYYKMLLCAGNNGSNGFATSTNTISASNPGGIFSFENYCGPAPDPAGNSAFVRIVENQSAGNAGLSAYGSMSWTAPGFVTIAAGGGYTREPNAFNDGWRGRFWGEGYDGSTNNILMQGAGVANGSLGGIGWGTTSTFAPHLWPFGGYGSYRRFVFELTCYRQAGCDRANFNAVDANTLTLTLNDVDPAHTSLTNTGAGFLGGQWVRGSQTVTWNTSDVGSGLRFERVRIDGAQQHVFDFAGSCNLGWTGSSGEFARDFQPCPVGGPWGRSYSVNTAALADGAHVVQVCSQDYGQAVGLSGSGGESCDQRTVRTDNTAPGAPGGLVVTSANPNRYLPDFGASFSLPSNTGSPIVKAHYNVVNANGDVVSSAETINATNPTSLSGLSGPAAPGEYRLRVWLEDEVGNVGPAATAAIPHDVTAPVAPQGLRIAAESTERRVEVFGLRWQDPSDGGSPVDRAHYQVLDGAGKVVAATRTVEANAITAVDGVRTPSARGDYVARVWLQDAEGNVGAAAAVPLPRDTTPPAAPQGVFVTAPSASRSASGIDVRWQNLPDGGSPIDAAHYQVIDSDGGVAVPTVNVAGLNVESIDNLSAPRGSGLYTLRLWLSDEEGNVGAPISVPLSYSCTRSDAAGGQNLTAVIASRGRKRRVVRQGRGGTIRGRLTGKNGAGVGEASICVFSRVVTDSDRRFLGIAVSDADGSYRFAVPSGASREVSAVYRSGHRELSSASELASRVRPTFKVRQAVVRNKRAARFFGRIPGPHNDRVVVVLQVKSGKGWRAFRRYRTRRNGKFSVSYRFTQTPTPTTYVMRAQVRATTGYPYLQGNSRRLRLRVLP